MSGIINSTGARSGVIGTTVGTPSTAAGTGAFMARFSSGSWLSIADNGTILAFNDDSTGDSYDTDGNFNTSTSKYEVPADGVYYFFYGLYTAQNDTDNAFGFTTNNGEVDNQDHVDNYGTWVGGTAGDHIQTCSHVLTLSASDTVWITTRNISDIYTGHCHWGGCRLK
jgi:hypothetical protein